jgi:hypothetical protein
MATVTRFYNQRGLTPFASGYVGEGRLDVDRVLSPEKISDITEFFTQNPKATVAQAKASMGATFSYGELKMIAWRFRSDHT